MVFLYKTWEFIRNILYFIFGGTLILCIILFIVMKSIGGVIFSLIILGPILWGINKIDQKFTTPDVELYKREKIKEIAKQDVRNARKHSFLNNLSMIANDLNKRKPKKPEGESLF